ncbi:uncharacterized protein LOC113340517 [Papaver somniferum]|uniref:uncharacterized protein LOC113340517 n=1 Tax=Papaver somniferum TaxID=3469 RepID=UPI000E701806|nr:uncharacterized protein LOC113340517 [Papaver somniferum]
MFQYIKTCYWSPPEQDFVMFCCDGSSFGNPGSAGFGFVVRDSNCQVLGAMSGGIGVATNYLAEYYGIMCAVELDVQWGMLKIIIVSYFKFVLTEFAKGRVPWFMKGGCKNATRKLNQIKYQHGYRETNFTADCMTKKVAALAASVRQIYIGRPRCLPRV